MYKLIGAMTMLFLASVACIGTFTGWGKLSVEEFAEKCGGIVGEASSYGESAEEYQAALDEWNSLKPPNELKRYHDLYGKLMALALQIKQEEEAFEDELNVLQDQRDDPKRSPSQLSEIDADIAGLRRESRERLNDLRDKLYDESNDLFDEIEDMRGRIRRALQDEGCA